MGQLSWGWRSTHDYRTQSHRGRNCFSLIRLLKQNLLLLFITWSFNFFEFNSSIQFVTHFIKFQICLIHRQFSLFSYSCIHKVFFSILDQEHLKISVSYLGQIGLFKNCYCLVIQLCLTLQSHGLYVACQPPLSMGFPRQEYWEMGCHFLSQGIFPD